MIEPLPDNAQPSRLPLPGEADPHFGTNEQMLNWCESEGIIPVKDEDGDWDWHAAWDEYMKRP